MRVGKKVLLAIFLVMMIALSGCFPKPPKLEADLAPQNLKSPQVAQVDSIIGGQVSLEVKNVGTGSADANDGHFVVGFYLSKDQTWDSTDQLLVGGRHLVNTPLDQNGVTTVSVNKEMKIPADLNPGTYYLLAYVDLAKEVVESNDDNNFIANAITIEAKPVVVTEPDLALQNFVAPTSALQGEAIGSKMSLELINKGTGAAESADGYIFVGFYLSKDQKLDSSDPLLLGGREDEATPIAAGAVKGIGIASSMSIPADTVVGDYYIVAMIDEGKTVAESDETNNYISSPITVQAKSNNLPPVQKADLVLKNYQAPTVAEAGGIVGNDLSVDVYNIGLGEAVTPEGYIFVGFYLSTDQTWDSSDQLLTGGREDVDTPIAAGAFKAVTIFSGMTIPEDVAAGDYYLLAVVDDTKLLAEESETNNVLSSPLVIEAESTPSPVLDVDLMPYNLVSPSIVVAGEDVSYSIWIDIKNMGTDAAESADGNITIAFYLSQDTIFDTSDLLLTNGDLNQATPVAAGESVMVETPSNMSIPMDITPGDYHVLAVVDVNEEVAETDESNNVVSNSITISDVKPDLNTYMYNLPSVAEPGQTIGDIIHVEVRNWGSVPAQAADGDITVSFYLSADASLDENDPLLILGHQSVVTPIDWDGMAPLIPSLDLAIPADTVPGEYFLFGVVDSMNEVEEMDETNNIFVDMITIIEPVLLFASTDAGVKKVGLDGSITDFSPLTGPIETTKTDVMVFERMDWQIVVYSRAGDEIKRIDIDPAIPTGAVFDFVAMQDEYGCVYGYALLDGWEDKVYLIDSMGYEWATISLTSTPTVQQVMDAVQVGNSLVVSSDGENRVIKIDYWESMDSVEIDLSADPFVPPFTGIEEDAGIYYLGAQENLYTYDHAFGLELVGMIPAGHIRSIVKKGDQIFVAIDGQNEIRSFDINTGTFTTEVLINTLDIEK